MYLAIRNRFILDKLNLRLTQTVYDSVLRKHYQVLKGELSGQGQFLATESPFKNDEECFYFTLKPLFVLKIYKFLF